MRISIQRIKVYRQYVEQRDNRIPFEKMSKKNQRFIVERTMKLRLKRDNRIPPKTN
jgi:hypothetical protein